jgi:hypothetical protein
MISFPFIEVAKNTRQLIWEILGDEARPELDGCRAVQPYCGGRGKEWLHALCEESEHDSTQNIARPCGGQ